MHEVQQCWYDMTAVLSSAHYVRGVACQSLLLLQMFKPPKLRKSGASSSDDGLPTVLPADKETHSTGRGNHQLAQRNSAAQTSNTLSPSGSQYPSGTHVQQRYAFL